MPSNTTAATSSRTAEVPQVPPSSKSFTASADPSCREMHEPMMHSTEMGFAEDAMAVIIPSA